MWTRNSSWLKKAARKAPSATEAPEESGLPTPTEPEARPATHEYWLLKLLFMSDEFAPWTAAHLDLQWIQHTRVRDLIGRRLAAEARGDWQGVAAFLAGCEDDASQALITEALAEERAIPNPAQQLQDITLRLRNQFIDRELSTAIQRAANPETGDAERLDLLRRQQELRQEKLAPLGPLASSASNDPPV